MISKKFILTFSSVSCWAVSISISRYLFKMGESPYTLLLWASFFALPFWTFIFIKNKKEVMRLTKKDILLLVLIGGVGTVLSDILEFFSIKYTQATNFALLYRTVTIFTVIFAWVFFGEKITRRKSLLLLMIFSGSFLFATSGAGISLSLGDIFAILVALVNAFFFNILLKHACSNIHPFVAASGTFFAGFLPIIFLTAAQNAIRPPVNASLIFLMTVINILLILFRNKAYTIASASYVSMIFSLTPVLVAALSFTFLGESLTAVQILGGILIISSGILTEKLKI